MTRKLRYGIALAVITGLGIIAAQSYWLVRTYQIRKTNFARSASEALGFATLSNVMAKQFGAPVEKNIFDSANNFLKKTIPDSISHSKMEPASQSSIIAGAGNEYPMEIDFVDSLHAPILTAQSATAIPFHLPDSIRPVQINIDDRIFQQKLKESLKQSKIEIPFSLSIRPFESKDKEKHLVSHLIIANGIPVRYLALDFPGMKPYLFRSMLAEFLLSAVIIIIGAVSFIYLLKTIYWQKQFAEMKNEFISNISHELKTPVSVMMATNEALIKFNVVNDKEKTERYLGINRDELNKLQGMIERIVSIGKQEDTRQSLPFKKIELDVFLQKIMNRFAGFENLQLHYSNKMGYTGFATNAEALETILTNLIDNAIKYNDKLQQQVWIDCKSSENGITITVKDDGAGIEKKYLPFVFDKFYRVPHGNLHDVKGFGLGLSQVKELIEQLNGTIEVYSQLGNGTQFIINLPSHEYD